MKLKQKKNTTNGIGDDKRRTGQGRNGFHLKIHKFH